MHLIVVRRDATGFQHVHPEMAADGTWSLPVTLPAAGSYRAFADFTPAGGTGTVLGVDLAAPGPFEPVAHAPSRTAHVDGYTVELAGDLLPGRASPVTLTVTRDGQPVTDLQPYLGAYGHLVALREGDLAYLHVHPDGAPGDGARAGPQVEFVAEVPTRRDLPAVPGLPARRGRPHRGVHRRHRTGTRRRRPRPGTPDAPRRPRRHGH